MFVRLARFALSVTAYSLLLWLIVALGLFAIGIATADEARSVGKQVLLSSIPAHSDCVTINLQKCFLIYSNLIEDNPLSDVFSN